MFWGCLTRFREVLGFLLSWLLFWDMGEEWGLSSLVKIEFDNNYFIAFCMSTYEI